MFVLEADPEVAPRATLLLPDGVHSLALLRGHGLDDDDHTALSRSLAVYCDDEELALPDWFWAGVAPVVSGRLRAALVSLGVDNLEAFPVTVEHDLGPVTAEYYALNVVGCVACIDLGRSEYTTFEGRLFALETMHVDPRLPADVMLFRPAEWPMVLLVRDELAAALAAMPMTGLRLTPTAAWRNLDF
jgi:hypothetical protein